MSFTPGDRVQTPTGEIGTVQPSPWLMPRHSLIKFENGQTQWILTHLLQPAEHKASGEKSRQTRKPAKRKIGEL